jgi:NADH dehydrogenase
MAPIRIVVTGANSALGRVVIERALLQPEVELVLLVRSARAESELPPVPRDRVRVARVDWSEAAGLRAACEGAAGMIHLAGVLIESRTTRHAEANVETTRAAVAAARAAAVAKLVFVSAVFADPLSANPYWRSKGAAEALVRESGLAYTILRCPLLLGCRSAGVQALVREVNGGFVPLPGGGVHLEQPLDARDLADGALRAAASVDCARDAVLDVVGPESLSLRALILRGARGRPTQPRIVAVPTALVKAALALRTRLLGPGFSPEVIDVMMADTRIDPEPAAKALGITLRPLDETLAYSLTLGSVA